MKKITLSLFALLFSIGFGYSQANVTVLAPPFLSTTQLRAPNGLASHTGMRGCFLVLQSELTGLLTSNNLISAFGFSLTQGTGTTAVTGSITIWMENTTNSSYLKGTTWGAPITTGMTQVYSGNMTVPASAGANSIVLPISNFPYAGNGIYVAYDWTSSGPFDASPATYCANGTGLTGGGATAESPTLPTPTALSSTNFRPSFIFTAANTATNEIQVTSVSAPGKIAYLLNTPHNINTVVKNASSITKTNISVSVAVTGANPFTSSFNIPSLAAGASSTISFGPYNPQNPGLSVITATIAPDQNNTNNSATWSQSVTCNVAGLCPPTGVYTGGVGFNTGSGIIANPMVPPATTNLSGVRIAISSDAAAVGNSVYGALLSSAGAIIATTNTITITAGMAGVFQNFVFSPALNVTAGVTYYIGLAQTVGTAGYFPIGTQPSTALPSGILFQAPLAGGSITGISTNLGFFGIEPVYAPTGLLITTTQSSVTACRGDAITLTASGVNSYTWSTTPPSFSSSIVVTPSVTTSYTVSGTGASGCTNLSVITHSVVNFTITASSNKPTNFCPFNTATLTATGANTYSWSNASTTSNKVVINPNVTTSYTVVGFESTYGCRSNAVVITQSVALCTGVAANTGNLAEVKVFPNPLVNGKSEISGLTGVNTITVYNILGQSVYSAQTAEESIVIDLSTLPNGNYVVKIADDTARSKSVKIVNQN
jgi:hypothetical protein